MIENEGGVPKLFKLEIWECEAAPNFKRGKGRQGNENDNTCRSSILLLVIAVVACEPQQGKRAPGRGDPPTDFNNLLTIIKGNSELSLMDVKEDDPIRENLKGILGASGRASGLIRQLLAFSRRQILEMKVLDLNSLLMDLDKMLHRLIGEDIELVILPCKDLGRVKADAGTDRTGDPESCRQ